MQTHKQKPDWAEQNELQTRSAKEVIEDHIQLQVAGELEVDLDRNYATDAVLLTDAGHHGGHAGLRANVSKLYRQVPGAYYEIASLQVQDNYALLIWKAGSPEYVVDYAADSFVVIDGKIRMQTSHAQSNAVLSRAG